MLPHISMSGNVSIQTMYFTYSVFGMKLISIKVHTNHFIWRLLTHTLTSFTLSSQTVHTYSFFNEALRQFSCTSEMLTEPVTDWLCTGFQYNEALTSIWFSCDHIADCYQAGVSSSHSHSALFIDQVVFHLMSQISPVLVSIYLTDER